MENIKVLSHQIIVCHKHHTLFLGERVIMLLTDAFKCILTMLLSF